MPKAARREPLPLLAVANREELRAWLEANHAISAGVRLVLGKKGSTATALRYEDAVEEALAFGWIDSTSGRLDDQRWTVQFTPRKPGSNWSRSNKQRLERLIPEGRIAPAGLAVVEAAKADGSWESIDDVEDMVMPADLATALETDPDALTFWEALPAGQRKISLYWIGSAKRPETRAKRIAETIAAAREQRRMW